MEKGYPGICCIHCHFYDDGSDGAVAGVVAPPQCGFCRRKPPTPNEETGRDEWPMVRERDWCGEFQLDPMY